MSFLFAITVFANDIGLFFLEWMTLVLLVIVSLAAFLTIELCFLLCEYNKIELAFVLIATFLLKFSLSFLINPFLFYVCGFNILLNSLLVIFLILIYLVLYDVVLLSFVCPFFSNKVLD